MELVGDCSVMKEISKTEEAITSTYDRIKALETKIASESLPENKRKILDRELEEVKKLLKTHEDQLAHLRTHNRKTFVVVAALVFIIFAVYMLYVLVGGRDF